MSTHRHPLLTGVRSDVQVIDVITTAAAPRKLCIVSLHTMFSIFSRHVFTFVHTAESILFSSSSSLGVILSKSPAACCIPTPARAAGRAADPQRDPYGGAHRAAFRSRLQSRPRASPSSRSVRLKRSGPSRPDGGVAELADGAQRTHSRRRPDGAAEQTEARRKAAGRTDGGAARRARRREPIGSDRVERGFLNW